MTLRMIEVVASRENRDAIEEVAAKLGVLDCWRCSGPRQQPAVMRVLVPANVVQPLLDRLQTVLSKDERTRIVLVPVLAALPENMADDDANNDGAAEASREELYDSVSGGVDVNGVFVFLVLLSTAVAAIGMLRDNVAVVIGAMVIAPLLGPNLAFALAVTLGDRDLMVRSLRASAIGFSLTMGVSILAGLLLPLELNSQELLSRTQVSFDSVGLALASGAAAVLSLTSGLSSALVGVMVAVALLPPAATFGFMLGAGLMAHAAGAATLLAVNLVCVVLSAQLVFLARGIKPRTWWRRKNASQSTKLSIIVSSLLLTALIVLIYVQQEYLTSGIG